MIQVLIPHASILLSAYSPILLQSCLLEQAVTPSDPGSGQPAITPPDVWVPIAPTVPEESIATIAITIDDSPSQIIGCIYDASGDAEQKLNALFPNAEPEDGVVERLTNDIWVLRDGSWQNVGPTPGPRVVFVRAIPPSNETESLEGVITVGVEAISLPYALESTTIIEEIIRIGIFATQAQLITIPNQALLVQSFAPGVAAGASIQLELFGIELRASAPVIVTPAMVPAASIVLQAPDPLVRIQGRVPIPAGSLSLAGVTPTIKASAYDYWSNWAEQNYGWWPDSYPAWWAN